MSIASYRDLDIWQIGMNLIVEVYRISRHLPDSERYNLVSQMQRASISVSSNIAEGWGRGRGAAQAQFIRTARGSLYELDTQLEAAERLALVQTSELQTARRFIEQLGKKLNAYLASLETSYAREGLVEYH